MINTQGIRKAAIFIDCLEPEAADRLLEQLPPEYAQQVRNTWMTLGRISAEERDQVIREFLNRVDDSKISIQALTVQRSPETEKTVRLDASRENRPADTPFRILQDAEADKLASILAGERAPTIALVLAHLAPAQAGAVLVRFPRERQVEIVRCLLELEETDPDILREIDKALQEKLAQISNISRRRVAGLTTITGMVEHCRGGIADQVLQTLYTVAPEVAEQLAPLPPVDFNQFIRFDDVALGLIFEHASPEVAVLALWGAPLGLLERVLKEISPWKAKAIQSQLVELGPVRLRDVEEARQRLGELARRLAIAGKIRLPPGVTGRSKNGPPTETGDGVRESPGHFVRVVE
ncbi:FliG C-terminal domain-containing protein [Thermogutta sp.]|uniref:FliG C-terminal domain-containing protein n=1 Tax=Thermogutta sp. TaxID=1962930 RepID=UPI00321F9F6F